MDINRDATAQPDVTVPDPYIAEINHLIANGDESLVDAVVKEYVDQRGRAA